MLASFVRAETSSGLAATVTSATSVAATAARVVGVASTLMKPHTPGKWTRGHAVGKKWSRGKVAEWDREVPCHVECGESGPVPLSFFPVATVITESIAVLMVQKMTALGASGTLPHTDATTAERVASAPGAMVNASAPESASIRIAMADRIAACIKERHKEDALVHTPKEIPVSFGNLARSRPRH